jgi:hypothetical protein
VADRREGGRRRSGRRGSETMKTRKMASTPGSVCAYPTTTSRYAAPMQSTLTAVPAQCCPGTPPARPAPPSPPAPPASKPQHNTPHHSHSTNHITDNTHNTQHTTYTTRNTHHQLQHNHTAPEATETPATNTIPTNLHLTQVLRRLRLHYVRLLLHLPSHLPDVLPNQLQLVFQPRLQLFHHRVQHRLHVAAPYTHQHPHNHKHSHTDRNTHTYIHPYRSSHPHKTASPTTTN